MLPSELKPERFSAYPPQARKLATDNIAALQHLPLSFLPSLLREVIDYDFKFPAERKALEKELANLNTLSAAQVADWFQPFSEISLSPKLERFDWVNSPAQFVEQLSSHLWTTHQLDAFRPAATRYADRLQEVVPPDLPLVPRLGISIVGQGVDSYEAWKQLSIDNVRRMIRRDWNHPAIILWSVRINESKDDHDFYTRTNALAHQLDPTRQTGGIRVDLHAQAEALKSGKHEVIIEIASELVAIVRLTRARLAPATTMI